MSVAIITARGGSKRIPGKNIKPFFGKPMLAWPIEVALKSGLFQKVVVSTDSNDIADVAREFGAEVPFMRPPDLAGDFTGTAPVVAHALATLQNMGLSYTYACCIYPTSPFLLGDDLTKALAVLQGSNTTLVYSVTTFPYPILRAVKLLEDGSVAFNWPEYELTRSQDLPEFYHDAGQFYWLKTKAFMQNPKLLPAGAKPFFLPRKRVQDLDTLEDWDVAEAMAKVLLK